MSAQAYHQELPTSTGASPRTSQKYLAAMHSTEHPDAVGGGGGGTSVSRPKVVVWITRNALLAVARQLLRWGLTALALMSLLIFKERFSPYCRSFSFTDQSISHKHKPDTVPYWTLFAFPVSPAVISFILCCVAPIFPKLRWWELREMAYCTLLTATLSSLMTDPPKLYAGRLRPDFIDRLRIAGYNSTYPDPMATDYCTITNKIVVDGRLSFPSGHTSTAFASMTLCTLILMNRFRTFHQPEWRVVYFLVAAFPLVIAFTVAISRTRDERHHFSDILGGSLVGTISALLSFRLVFSYCRERLMFIPTMFVRSSGHGGSSGSTRRTVGYRTSAAACGGSVEEVGDDELPPVVHEEMPVIA